MGLAAEDQQDVRRDRTGEGKLGTQGSGLVTGRQWDLRNTGAGFQEMLNLVGMW